MILFRHAKARGASSAARRLVRSTALSIVEHPHFTPERIRRFVTDRLEALPQIALKDGLERVRDDLKRELASPTEAMRTSFRALETEHRELLIALLDAPAGLIDERELAATVRRHHAGGLSRPPGELIDRLTDHFLRITPVGIGWVHPSWRDLVINELREDAAGRGRFLDACALHGTMLALSQEGGIAGERTLPLLVSDRDWDRLGDRIRQLADQLEDQELAQLLLALRDVRIADIARSQRHEARTLAAYLLVAVARRWDQRHRPVPGFLIESWYTLWEWAPTPIEPPQLGPTWAELYPASPPAGGLERAELARADEWLALAQTLLRYDPDTLTALGFFKTDRTLLRHLAETLAWTTDQDTRPLAESIVTRIQELAPGPVTWPPMTPSRRSNTRAAAPSDGGSPKTSPSHRAAIPSHPGRSSSPEKTSTACSPTSDHTSSRVLGRDCDRRPAIRRCSRAFGALKKLDENHAEVKSMHTAEAARGRGIGRAMIDHLLSVARDRGFRRVSLETGSMTAFAPARSLYASVGFRPCGPFGEYVPSRNSTFMTLLLLPTGDEV